MNNLNKPTYLSKEGLAKLREELDEMINVKRAEVAARIHDAKEHGDITENAEYEDAKNEQAFVEGRIQQLEALINEMVILQAAERDSLFVVDADSPSRIEITWPLASF